MEVFNSQFASQQMSGNHEILCRLLAKFIDDYQNAETDIKTMLEQEDHSSVVLMLHTLKGVSGNLGMENLHEFCTNAESLAKEQQLHPDDLTQLTTLIASTTKEVNVFMNNQVPEQNTVIIVDEFTDARGTLLSYLHKNQFIPFDTLTGLIEGLSLEHHAKAELSNAIQLLDYERALAIIEENNE